MSPAGAGLIHLEGCTPEVLMQRDGRILAVGTNLRTDGSAVVRVAGRALPGLHDAHLHLDGLATLKLQLPIRPNDSLERVLIRVQNWASRLGQTEYVLGRGWSDETWPDSPTRAQLDHAGGGRPVVLWRKDGHSAWLSSAALANAGVNRHTQAPPGGVIERDPSGEPSGVLREEALAVVESSLPPASTARYRLALKRVLRDLARRGLTSVHSVDPPSTFALLQDLRREGPLPVRVTYNLPRAELAAAERLGVRSGWGDEYLRIWGVKAFLDGSLGSGTAEMLGGTGVATLPQDELEDLIARAAQAELNVLLHAIGDQAVRRALDALLPYRGAWRLWRPRIEHAQCVHPDDRPRFAASGTVASMQPIHAVADRRLADARWGGRAAHAYAWGALRAAGAVLAFGSDAPVETPDPLAGLWAATAWRREVGWFPELRLTRPQALAAYTSGAAYSVGLEQELGRLAPGYRADVTVVAGDRVVATVVAGRVTYRAAGESRPTAPPSSARDADSPP